MRMHITPTPYRGNQPYIFMSYSHRNMEAAMKIVERLQVDGYRVWYDEGIDPGTEWDENIASHVESCGFFVALLSSEYLDSSNCRDELNYARDLGKPRLLIYLEDIQLPGGMQMRLSRLQAVHQYRYKNPDRFYEKLYASQGMEVCLEEKEESAKMSNGSVLQDEQPLPSGESNTVDSGLHETAGDKPIAKDFPEVKKEIQKTEEKEAKAVISPLPASLTSKAEEKEKKGINKKILIPIIAGVAAVIAGVVGIVVGITAGSSGGETETSQVAEATVKRNVPNLIDMSTEEAEKALKKTGLTMKITEERFSEKVEKGKIISQEQKKNEKVDEGSVIGVVVSKGPEMVTVPSVVGEKKEHAKKELEKIGLVCKFEESYNESVEKGSVIEQNPAEKKSVKKGGSVTLIISKGAEPAPSSQETTASEEPTYQEPVYQEPTYQEPTYQEPIYQEPAQETPAQETPAEETPAQEAPAEQPADGGDSYDAVVTGDF